MHNIWLTEIPLRLMIMTMMILLTVMTRVAHAGALSHRCQIASLLSIATLGRRRSFLGLLG